MQSYYDDIAKHLSCPEDLGRILLKLVASADLAAELERKAAALLSPASLDLRMTSSDSMPIHMADGFTLYFRRYGGAKSHIMGRTVEDGLIRSHGVPCIGVFAPGSFVTVTQYAIGERVLRPVRSYVAGSVPIHENPQTGIVSSYDSQDGAWMLRLNFGRPEASIKCFNRHDLTFAFTRAVEGTASGLVTLCSVLGATSDQGAVPYLAELTGHDIYFVRWAAIQALGLLDGSLALDALRRATNDPHEIVRQSARRSLDKLGVVHG